MTAKALIIAGYGLNCEEESAYAFDMVGFDATIMHINDLIESPKALDAYQALCIPGGFSYGDDTGSGNAFAQKMRLTLTDSLKEFVARDTLTIGICNGCQIGVNLGLAPAIENKYGERQVAVTHNASARYQCRWVDMKVEKSNSPWLQNVDTLHVPVAHGEGRFMMSDGTLKTLQDNNQIALRYTKPSCHPVASDSDLRRNDNDVEYANGEFPFNPNGSTDDIAGMTDESGRVLVMMPHPERGMFTWQRDDYALLKDKAARENQPLPEASDGLQIFQNAATYFGANRLKKTA